MSEIQEREVVESLIAADGGRLHPTANSLADFLRMVEDGQFDADVMYDMRKMAEDLEDLFQAQGGKLKATINLKITLTREVDGYYLIQGEHKIAMPKVSRKRSIAWLTENNLFTPNQPKQASLFGTVRDVTPRGAPRN
jgi:hypothetical protein